MIKKIFNLNIFFHVLLIICLIISKEVYSQQESQYSHYMFNHTAVNPGFAGTTNSILLTGIVRQQWIGFKDESGNKVAPESVLLSGDAPIKFLNGGVSASIIQDKLGFFQDLYIRLGYSYHLPLFDGKLGIGANIDFINKKLDNSKFTSINESDPVISGSGKSSMFTDLAVGLFYKSLSGFYVGLSSTQLLETKRELNKENPNSMFKLRRHYFLTTGHKILWLRNPAYQIMPSLLFKYDGTLFQINASALVEYNKKVWGGISYRFQDAVIAHLGINIQELSIGYSYDVPISKTGSSGSHEIILRYNFQLHFDKVKKSVRNTRYL